MEIWFDKEVDIMYISFSNNKIVESDENKQGLILDYDKDGSIVGIEILNASKRVTNRASMECEVA